MIQANSVDIYTAVVALGLSVLGGVPITMIWSRYLHHRLKDSHSEEFSKIHRDPWISFVVGVLERGLITALVIWLPQSVGPMTSAVHVALPLREDVVTEGGDPARVLANAPKTVNNFFVVPKVVE